MITVRSDICVFVRYLHNVQNHLYSFGAHSSFYQDEFRRKRLCRDHNAARKKKENHHNNIYSSDSDSKENANNKKEGKCLE